MDNYSHHESSYSMADSLETSKLSGTNEIIIPLEYGFTKKVVQRRSGTSAGKYDVYIYSPDKKRFCSRKKLMQYLHDQCPDIPSEIFEEAFYYAKNLNSPHRSQRNPITTDIKRFKPSPLVESSDHSHLDGEFSQESMPPDDDFQAFSQFMKDKMTNILDVPERAPSPQTKSTIIVDFSDDEEQLFCYESSSVSSASNNNSNPGVSATRFYQDSPEVVYHSSSYLNKHYSSQRFPNMAAATSPTHSFNGNEIIVEEDFN